MRILREYEIDGERIAVAVSRRRRALPVGWSDTSIGEGKINLRRRHVSGWEVVHCGHPTALYPYTAHHDDGRMLVANNGRGWPSLSDAMRAVEEEARRG